MDVVAEHPTGASGGAEVAREDIDRGGLTSAILPQETENPPPRDLKGEVLVDETLPVVVGQVAAFDDVFLHMEELRLLVLEMNIGQWPRLYLGIIKTRKSPR